jgi:AAA domain
LKPIPATIDGLLYHGHTLLAGPPKLGKSYLGLQFAHAVASGDAALGGLPVSRRGKVLYLALEDGERRVKVRTDKLLATEQPDWLRDITVVYELPHGLDTDPGLDALSATLTADRYELVIVDTYVKAFPGEAGTRDLFKGDYKQMDRLTKLAEKHDLAILTIIHTRKPGKGEDGSSLVSVAGTGGRTAAADAILMLSGTSGKPTAKLTLISRDIDGFEATLTRDPDTSGWKATGGGSAAAKARAGEAEICALLAKKGPMRAADIERELAPTKPATVRSWLSRLADADVIDRLNFNRYGLPTSGS